MVDGKINRSLILDISPTASKVMKGGGRTVRQHCKHLIKDHYPHILNAAVCFRQTKRQSHLS